MGGGGLEEVWGRVPDLTEHLNLEFYGIVIYLMITVLNYEVCLGKLESLVYTVPAVFVAPYVHGAPHELGVHATSPGTCFRSTS